MTTIQKAKRIGARAARNAEAARKFAAQHGTRAENLARKLANAWGAQFCASVR
jgi:hypothetical protein